MGICFIFIGTYSNSGPEFTNSERAHPCRAVKTCEIAARNYSNPRTKIWNVSSHGNTLK
jgi:hypothetical protein